VNGRPAKRCDQAPLPTARFNMARYCVGARGPRRPEQVGLIVLHDADEPLRHAEHWTYAQLRAAVGSVAAGLRDLGLRRGDRVLSVGLLRRAGCRSGGGTDLGDADR
jgi:hypothetical protein